MLTAQSRRMAKVDRRDQLLDVAGDLVLGRGVAAVTIERVAAEAGVSRALAYQHFDNADDVLLALYRREVAHLAEQILGAVDAVTLPEAKLRAAIGTFLDVVQARGALLTVLTAAGSDVAARADAGTRGGPRFAESLFRDIFGMSARPARVAAAMTFGALNGGVEAWMAGELRRPEVEDAAVAVALGLAGRGAP